ncbi:MAG: RNA polymerase sigma factor [Lachnospiraceae bacterium]|nr:RNA polymerase sigma factor [Lachnospiraceae bacterium]
MNDERFAECMKAMSEGNRDALREIYEEYHSWLYSVVYGVLQQKERAEDVSADLFLRIWNSASNFKAGTGHRGYLATIARNMAIDELRKRKREVYLDGPDTEDDTETDIADDTPGPEAETVQNLSIQQALERLKPAEREVVNMKVLSEMTFQEISDTLGIPMGTVTWRYQAAIKKLRSCGYEQGF